jgi:hypothetical protein
MVTKDGNTLKTTKMVYREAEHTLFFPDELIMESENILARADEAAWNLKTNIFEAWGGVSIHFKPKSREQEALAAGAEYVSSLEENSVAQSAAGE